MEISIHLSEEAKISNESNKLYSDAGNRYFRNSSIKIYDNNRVDELSIYHDTKRFSLISESELKDLLHLVFEETLTAKNPDDVLDLIYELINERR